jgi:micrococcal nuclease
MEFLLSALITSSLPTAIAAATEENCDPAYAEVCIPPAPPDLDCGDISAQNFRVYLPGDRDVPEDLEEFDPHRFDGDDDGIGCEHRD